MSNKEKKFVKLLSKIPIKGYKKPTPLKTYNIVSIIQDEAFDIIKLVPDLNEIIEYNNNLFIIEKVKVCEPDLFHYTIVGVLDEKEVPYTFIDCEIRKASLPADQGYDYLEYA